MHKKHYCSNENLKIYPIVSVLSTLHRLIVNVIWVIWMRIAVVPTLWLVEIMRCRKPWLPDIPVSLLPQVGINAAQEVYGFCVSIPQLEQHTLWKAALRGDTTLPRPPIREPGLFWRWMPATVADSIGEMGQSTVASRGVGAGVGKNSLFAFTQYFPMYQGCSSF